MGTKIHFFSSSLAQPFSFAYCHMWRCTRKKYAKTVFQLCHDLPTVFPLFLLWCGKVVHSMFGSLWTNFYNFSTITINKVILMSSCTHDLVIYVSAQVVSHWRDLSWQHHPVQLSKLSWSHILFNFLHSPYFNMKFLFPIYVFAWVFSCSPHWKRNGVRARNLPAFTAICSKYLQQHLACSRTPFDTWDWVHEIQTISLWSNS